MRHLERTERRTTNGGVARSLAGDEPAAGPPAPHTPARTEQGSHSRYGLSPTVILLLAIGICWVVLLIVGPISVVDAMPDLDLGSGISLTPDGQIKLQDDSAPASMPIPEQAEYAGISMP